MKISISVLLILNCFFVQAQIDKIKLPEGIDEIKINYTTPIFSVYIDKKNNVFVENDLVEIGQIGKILQYFKYKIPEEHIPFVHVFIYGDKRAKYLTIDRVKTEVASSGIFNLLYKTGSVEDTDILKGVRFKNHFSFFRVNFIEKKITKKEEQEIERRRDSLKQIENKTGESMFFFTPPPPPLHWAWDFMERLYTDQQEIIDEILADRRFSCIRITNHGIKIDKMILSFSELPEIEKLFLSNEVLLVNFDEDLVYENYFKMISILRDFERKNKNKHIPLFAEISSEIEEIHKKANVKICN